MIIKNLHDKRLGALVDVDLRSSAQAPEGALVEDRQGNTYVVLHGCTSIKDAATDRMRAWLEANGAAYLPSRPWEDDPDWAWTAFKDLVAYDPATGEAAVCFNYAPANAKNVI